MGQVSTIHYTLTAGSTPPDRACHAIEPATARPSKTPRNLHYSSAGGYFENYKFAFSMPLNKLPLQYSFSLIVVWRKPATSTLTMAA